jgi:uncharacterized protein (DUF952 family)
MSTILNTVWFDNACLVLFVKVVTPLHKLAANMKWFLSKQVMVIPFIRGALDLRGIMVNVNYPTAGRGQFFQYHAEVEVSRDQAGRLWF